MPSLAELRKQKLKEKKIIPESTQVAATATVPKKKNSLKITEIEKLHPPKMEEPEFFIDWDYLAHNSSFQRGFTEFIKHTFPQYRTINHRASKNVMNRQLREKTNEITTALDIVNKMNGELLQEIRKNTLFLKQQAKNKN